jgi:hypothetical protein
MGYALRMTDYRERKRVVRADGLAQLTLEEGEHGLCRFVIWKHYNPELGDLAWVPSRVSGFYPSTIEAEAAAAAEVDWLNA